MENILMLTEERFERQRFRITFKTIDFAIEVLKRDITKQSTEIRILLDGVVQNLVKREGVWQFSHGEDQGLARDIYRAIALRYRL